MYFPLVLLYIISHLCNDSKLTIQQQTCHWEQIAQRISVSSLTLSPEHEGNHPIMTIDCRTKRHCFQFWIVHHSQIDPYINFDGTWPLSDENHSAVLPSGHWFHQSMIDVRVVGRRVLPNRFIIDVKTSSSSVLLFRDVINRLASYLM